MRDRRDLSACGWGLMLACILLGTMHAHAQGPVEGPSSEMLQSCLLGTGVDTWNKLGLDRDQQFRMARIQEACREECNVPGVSRTVNPISDADGNTVMDEVRNVLSSDQYRAWVAYCIEAGKGIPK